MNSIIGLTVLFAFGAFAKALPLDKSLEIVKNNLDLYYVVPVEDIELAPVYRLRREVVWNVGNPGVTGTLKQQGTIFDNDNHKLDGNVHASKDFAHPGPVIGGGNLNYLHKPSGSGLSIGADQGVRGGTDFSASGKWNLYENKNGDIGIRGHYDRTFGGPGGRPNYGAKLEGNFRF